MRITITISLFFAMLLSGYAQTSKKDDSLFAILQKSDISDTMRLRILNQLAWNISYISLDSGLVLAKQGVALAQEIGSESGESEALNVIGTIYADMGRYEEAVDAHLKAIRLRVNSPDPGKMGESYHNLALVYHSMDSTATSLMYQRKAYSYYSISEDSSGLGPICCYMGVALIELDSIDEAISYFRQGVNVATIYSYEQWIAANKGGLAYCTALKGDTALADRLMMEAFALARTQDNKYEMMAAWLDIAKLRRLEKRYAEAIVAVDSALDISTVLSVRDSRMEHLRLLAELHELNGEPQIALNYYHQYERLKDSILGSKNQQNIRNLEAVYEKEKQEQELEILRQDDHLQRILVTGGIVFSVGFIVVAVLLFGRIRMGKIAGQKLHEQKAVIQSKNKDITDSITYARRIQDAVTPIPQQLQAAFPRSFVFNKPRAIVSGDFWWTVETSHDYFIALGDCSGHGVPGGFMSVMAASFLNGIVIENGVHSPDEILFELNKKVRAALQHSQTNEDVPLVSDTIDIAICRIDKNKINMQCASAGMSVIIARKNQIVEYPGNEFAAGSVDAALENPFRLTAVSLHPGDTVFLLSDGIQSVLAPNGNVQTINDLLLTVDMDQPAPEKVLEDYLDASLQSQNLPDDILVIGIRTT